MCFFWRGWWYPLPPPKKKRQNSKKPRDGRNKYDEVWISQIPSIHLILYLMVVHRKIQNTCWAHKARNFGRWIHISPCKMVPHWKTSLSIHWKGCGPWISRQCIGHVEFCNPLANQLGHLSVYDEFDWYIHVFWIHCIIQYQLSSVFQCFWCPFAPLPPTSGFPDRNTGAMRHDALGRAVGVFSHLGNEDFSSNERRMSNEKNHGCLGIKRVGVLYYPVMRGIWFTMK